MRIEEVFEEDNEALVESLAVAKIRKRVLEKSKKGPKPVITTLQSPDNNAHYIVFVNEGRDSYSVEMVNGKFKPAKKMSVKGAVSRISELEFTGWTKVDSRSWADKYKIQIMFGVIGASTAIGLSTAGMVPATAVLMPIMATFFGIFANLFKEHISAPLRSLVASN